MAKKLTFSANFDNFWVSDVDFLQFLVKKQVPGDYFFGAFLKTVILSKSCSRCGGSTIVKSQTLQKSVRRPTPNGNGKKNRQNSLPATSPGLLFRPRARFLSILGSRTDPKMAPKTGPHPNDASFFCGRKSISCVFFARTCSGRLPDRFWRLRRPSRARFRKDFAIFFGTFLRGSYVCCVCCRFHRGVAGIHRQPPELTLRGASGVRRSREAI